MEIPEQEIPVVFSQMLQLFPDIPHDIVWMYVQQYSTDAEMCAHMLNQRTEKYTGPQLLTLANSMKCNILQVPHLMLNSETVQDNNNDVPLSNELPLLNHEDNDITESSLNGNEQIEEKGLNAHNFDLPTIDTELYENANCKSTDFREPLILDIVPDDDGMSHNWRPTVAGDVLCPDLFVPSPMFENFPLQSNSIANFKHNNSEFHMNPVSDTKESWRYSISPTQMYSYHVQDQEYYGNDIASYLHYQKSQMNVIRYEVIKAKIELSDLKDSVEKLDTELKEKMQFKSAQDIVDLNKEIEKLRLEVQCLCSEVDEKAEDAVLLGEVDEGFYEKTESSSNNAEIQSSISDSFSNYNESISTDIQDESNRWQCPKCTFANHPAINVCEMCQLPKPVTHRTLSMPSSSCYDHVEEKSLSVQS